MFKLKYIGYALVFVCAACNNDPTPSAQGDDTDPNAAFNDFKPRFLDKSWQQYPNDAIFLGYGKYYDILKIPDSASFVNDSRFYRAYLDSIRQFDYERLSDSNKINYRVIENHLRENIWHNDTLQLFQWDPSYYNIGAECYELLSQSYAPLDEKLKVFSAHIRDADRYFSSALTVLKQPTREHTRVAIQQNTGSLEVFGSSLMDSVRASALDQTAKDTLSVRVSRARRAINGYVAALQKMLNDKNQVFRDFRIGEALFNQKFAYEIVTDYTPRQIFDMALAAKKTYYGEMYKNSSRLWKKYCGNETMPTDSLSVIARVIDKISRKHVAPANVFDTLNKYLVSLKRFIMEKDLFDFDTTAPIKVRRMPAYVAGVTLASAEFPLPYQKETVAYYNIADLSSMPPAQAESQLRENNDYILQILSIHEAVPGHCLQGIYNSKSPSIVQAVFVNYTMIEGWANYCQGMMIENGWGGNTPEMQLMFDKWNLRKCCNAIIDYGIHCLGYTKRDVVNLLKREAFQEDAQIEEKYNRATVSQVQLCSYFTGEMEIFALRDAFKKKEGNNYTLKGFHEKFLSYGSSPVKYIREMMLR
jgi:uncharacterized protein (DUF885 family)